ncbi:MAG: hypothetical protein AB7T27_09580 [Kiritimatiellia bacterium]
MRIWILGMLLTVCASAVAQVAPPAAVVVWGETNAAEAVTAPAAETEMRIDRLEKTVAEFEKKLGTRVVGSRSPAESIEDQLADLERRLKRIERDIDDLERRVRRAERH